MTKKAIRVSLSILVALALFAVSAVVGIYGGTSNDVSSIGKMVCILGIILTGLGMLQVAYREWSAKDEK